MSCADESASIGNGVSVSKVMEVDYVVLRPRSVANQIDVTGTLLPGESAMLSAQTAGLIKGIYFEEGQSVSRGKLLVKLDDRQWLAQREKLEAQLQAAERDLARKQQLLEIKGVTQAEIDDATLLVESIQADIQELNVMVEYASIRAPFSGQIGLRTVSPGAYLSAGTPVARLVSVNPLKLEFNVPERYASQIKVGQAVSFSITGSDSVFQGKVYATEPAISESSRALRIRAQVPNKQGELIAGAFAEVKLALGSIPDALLIPTEAMVPQLNGQVVYLIREGRVQEVAVEPGIRLPRLIQIQEGLSVGDTIMVSGLLQAREGLAVHPGTKIDLQLLENE